MAKKNDTTQFLNNELKEIARARGATPIQAQAGINQAAVNRAKANVRRQQRT